MNEERHEDLFDNTFDDILPDGEDVRKRNVAYYYHKDVGNYHYGAVHPMKPQRLAACNDLVAAYQMPKYMHVVESPILTAEDIKVFHNDDYVEFLERITPRLATKCSDEKFKQFNIGDDCPIFAGMFDYCRIYSGGSVEGARRLNHHVNDIVINWPGGLHHAKKGQASGFCYVNDIVLGILELLKYHKRVLYIDIDIHHGDGVQEAFNLTDRVMTVSFHRFGNYFPGTGSIQDKGFGAGRYFSVNVPLHAGIQDTEYLDLFTRVITCVNETYDPDAIVLQCGSDSLSEDRLGQFSLTFDGHARAVKFVKSLNKPLMVLGGGGYTLRNVARCWAVETGVVLGLRMQNEIPEDALYYQYFRPSCLLRPNMASKFENMNSPSYLQSVLEETLTSVRRTQGAPSVQMQPLIGVRLEELDRIEGNHQNDSLDFASWETATKYGHPDFPAESELTEQSAKSSHDIELESRGLDPLWSKYSGVRTIDSLNVPPRIRPIFSGPEGNLEHDRKNS